MRFDQEKEKRKKEKVCHRQNQLNKQWWWRKHIEVIAKEHKVMMRTESSENVL